MSQRVALQLRDVSISFAGNQAVKQVSASIYENQIHGIIGPNGSGKTTLLNGTCGFVEATGEIALDGRRIDRLPAHRRFVYGLGRTFQNPRIDHTLTVRDVLRLGEHLRGLLPWALVTFRPREADRRLKAWDGKAQAMLTSLGLDPALLDERVASLSAGINKMVDIGRALLAEPKVLLLDEPTSGMNDAEIDLLADALVRVRDDGATIVLVEHHLRFVSRVCDSMTALESGAVIGRGLPQEVLASEDVVRAYLGDAEQPSLVK